MAMDSASGQSHHHQEVGSQTLESMLASKKTAAPEKKPRPAEQSLKCPRCDSSNTKFCYYNNYSLSQPRYFCKSCRRYWTKGGTLRNVPVGGGCRKNKRSSSSSSSSARRNQDHPIAALTPPPYDHPVPGFHPKPTPGSLGLDDPGLIDALRGGGFLEIPRGFHNFYGGGGDGGNFGMECGPGVGVELGMGMGVGMGMGMGIGMLNQEMGLMGFDEFCSGGAPAVTTTAAMKQEMCGGGSGVGGEKWGLNPWQSAGGVEDLDSTRIGSWNGIGSSNWHGLLNSPLM